MLWATCFVPRPRNNTNPEITGRELVVQRNPAEVSALTEQEMDGNVQAQSENRKSVVQEEVVATVGMMHRTYDTDRPENAVDSSKSILVNESNNGQHPNGTTVPLGIVGTQESGDEETEREGSGQQETDSVASKALFEEALIMERNAQLNMTGNIEMQTAGSTDHRRNNESQGSREDGIEEKENQCPSGNQIDQEINESVQHEGRSPLRKKEQHGQVVINESAGCIQMKRNTKTNEDDARPSVEEHLKDTDYGDENSVIHDGAEDNVERPTKVKEVLQQQDVAMSTNTGVNECSSQKSDESTNAGILRQTQEDLGQMSLVTQQVSVVSRSEAEEKTECSKEVVRNHNVKGTTIAEEKKVCNDIMSFDCNVRD